MIYRISAIAVFAGGVFIFFWNAWLRDSVSGDAVVGQAMFMLYLSGAMLIAALFLMLFPGYRPQDRYWGYATLGLVIGFWLQR
jgi:hypothetical protein